ncbi:hypothetical protein L2E82_01199 [Cichorium intybus]|uniref:Uncharacterized protein n=1 Tax=Cichorium intybus TaxID=13427 RepID=A0ACB9GZC6_CICIN|nr:hypothetical protein L2E82_01199 [Cichorium intybus]
MMYGTTSVASHLRPPAASKTSFLQFSDRPEPPLASFLPHRPPPTDFISPATSSRFLLANKALSDQFDPLLKQVSQPPTPPLPEKPDKFDPLFFLLTLFRSTDELEQEYLIEGLVAFNKAIAELFEADIEADNPVLHEKKGIIKKPNHR